MRCFSYLGVSVLALTVAYSVQAGAADISQTATAGKQVHTAQLSVNAAQVALNQIRAKARAQLQAKPEWSSAFTELRAAKAGLDAARRATLAAIGKSADYQKLMRERADLQMAMSGRDQNEAQIQKAGDQFVQDGFELKRLESEALSKDDNYGQAKARYDAAIAKTDGLDQQVTEAMQADPEYQQAMQRLTAAQQQLKAARGQLAQAVQAERQQELDKARQEAEQGATGN